MNHGLQSPELGGWAMNFFNGLPFACSQYFIEWTARWDLRTPGLEPTANMKPTH